MDRGLSARMDESTAKHITLLAQRLHTTKKRIIEGAIKMYADKINEEQNVDVLKQTFGAWKRRESVRKTVTRAKEAFRRSMVRRHK